MAIFSSCETIAIRSSGENAISSFSLLRGMRPSCACVKVSQKVMLSFVEYAMNFPCCGRAMHESLGKGRPGRCIGLPDFAAVGFDEEMLVEPEESMPRS